MIKSKVGSLKSGWCSVFTVFTIAAEDDVEAISDVAFESVEQGEQQTIPVLFFPNESVLFLLDLTTLFANCLRNNKNVDNNCAVILEDQVLGDCFVDCVTCLLAFANNKISSRSSLKAIALLRICEDRLADVRRGVLFFSVFISSCCRWFFASWEFWVSKYLSSCDFSPFSVLACRAHSALFLYLKLYPNFFLYLNPKPKAKGWVHNKCSVLQLPRVKSQRIAAN